LLVAAALLVAAGPAAAKPEDPPSTPPAAAPAGTAKEPTAADREKSRAAFRRGVAQLRAQDWAGARASFEEAWALVQHPSILLNLGIAHLRTDDPVLAEHELVRFLSEDTGAQPDEITGAREALVEARSKIGTLRVVVTPPAAKVTIDGEAAALRPADGVAEARLKAGKHTVAASADGFGPEQREVDVPAKSEAEVKLQLVAKPGEAAPPAAAAPGAPAPSGAAPPLRKIAGYSLAGVSGIALIVSGVLALEALSDSHDYGDPKSPSFQKPDVKSEGIAFRTGADVAFLAALLAGAGAVILLFTDIGASPKPASLQFSPLRGVGSPAARLQDTSPLTLRW
jgi:hypothetical protein